jgi:hypothetical protein
LLKAYSRANSGNIRSAINTQVEQGLLNVFLRETMFAHDWGDSISDFCVADYLAKFNPVHLGQYSTPVLDLPQSFVWSILRVGRNPISGWSHYTLEAGRYRRTHN